MSHLEQIILDTRPGYHYFLMISVGLLLAIAVFLLGGGWLHTFLTTNKSAWLNLMLWVVLIVACARILTIVREHGRIIMTPTSFTQKQMIGTTQFNFAEVKSVVITTSTRTVAQNGVTIRAPRLLAQVTLRTGTVVPVVLSVFTEAAQTTVRAVLESAAKGSAVILPMVSMSVTSVTILFYRAAIFFALISAIIPVVVLYGKK